MFLCFISVTNQTLRLTRWKFLTSRHYFNPCITILTIDGKTPDKNERLNKFASWFETSFLYHISYIMLGADMVLVIFLQEPLD